MTMSGFSSPACKEIRQLLGVYVVGAIDPAERAIVDEHLGQCQLCRDELAGLAGLPAMLSRVPAADVEWLDSAGTELPELEPSDEMLASLLRKVSVKHRSRLRRSVLAVAAAAVIAAGGAGAVMQLTRPHVTSDTATAASPSGIAAVVDYSPTGWGTAIRIQVSGIPAGTKCQFWVVGKNGQTSYAGTWTVGSSLYSHKPWYSASSSVASGSVSSFRITSGGRTLLKIPAT
ncbi:MAG TPA: zf-HC2 domain-containing protein [Streptosporangiaceae bacterium]|nr:zf-HC2 domain-containing protein [Streptosporangiaceae bacterium]